MWKWLRAVFGELMQSGKLIVSCTTTDARLDLLFYMLQSIKKQTLKPDKITVQLSTEPYLKDNGIASVPAWMYDEPIEIRWVENIGSYRKLLPVINECTDDDLVVTADDDIIYHKDWLSRLCSVSKRNGEHIVCARARRMRRSIIGGWQNYRRWGLVTKEGSGMNLLPTGVAGVVYQRHLLDLDFLNDRSFISIAPTADDLWFRMASLRRSIPVYAVPDVNESNMFLRHSDSLFQANRNQSGARIAEKVYAHTVGEVQNWLGFDLSENDRSWRRIIELTGNELDLNT